MSDPPFEFLWQVGERASVRFRRLWDAVLALGPLDETHHGSDLLRFFLACGHSPAVFVGSQPREDIEHIHTNCAMAQGAALQWCGVPVRPGSGHSGWPMLGQPGHAWLGLDQSSRAWVKWNGKPDHQPLDSAIFFVQSDANPNNCHVGALLYPNADGSWATAEGGGGNGSLVHFSKRTIGPKFDARRLRGWFEIEQLDMPDTTP